nr:hypothetical protein [Tanacetum cinerariifolium]
MMASLSKDINSAGSDTRSPMLDRYDFESWQQHIHLYCKGKENGEKILQLIDKGPFKMGKFKETLADDAQGPELNRVFKDLTPKGRYKADIHATNILLQGLPKDIYTLISHYIDANDIRDNVKMLLEGLQVKQSKEGILISQDKYVAKILKKFIFFVKTAITPIETQKPLVKDEVAADVDVHLYRSMIGSLMYLMTSIPNIMFAVYACSMLQDSDPYQEEIDVITSTDDVLPPSVENDDSDGKVDAVVDLRDLPPVIEVFLCWIFVPVSKIFTSFELKVQINELNELCDQAYKNSLIYKEKTKRLHDSKIKNRVFNIGDIVLLQLPSKDFLKQTQIPLVWPVHYFSGLSLRHRRVVTTRRA